MTNDERNKKIIEAMRKQTQAYLKDPDKFKNWYRELQGPNLREYRSRAYAVSADISRTL